MSYILDALKKSEQARGSRKPRGLLKEPLEAPAASSQPPGSSRRWPFLIAFILFLNVGFFVFWLRPWQWGGNANGPRDRIPGGQSPETRRKAAPAVPPPHLAQSSEKREASKSPPGDEEKSALNPPKAQQATQALQTGPARPDRAPAPLPPTAPGVSRGVEVAVKKPDSPKLHQNPKAAGTKKDLKTANLETTRKNPALHPEQPLQPAAASEIVSDMQTLSELGASSGKPAANRVQKWRELAPQIRDAIPNLSVSMLIYSKKPEDRWININGSKKREGETISAGLKLEEITPDGAIFSYQGRRFYKSVVGD